MNIACYVCFVPTDNLSRLSRREDLFKKISNSRFNGLSLESLQSTSEWIRSLDEAFNALERFNLPTQRMLHSVIWMYHPQTQNYFPVGDWDFGQWRQYTNVLHYNLGGLVGVNLSFYKAMNEFLSTSNQSCIWLEDDTVLTDKWEIDVMRCLERAPSNWDVINLAEYTNFGTSIGQLHQLANEMFVLPYSASRCHCILISRAGAQKFLEFLQLHGSILPLDWILFNVRSPEVRDIEPVYFDTYFVNPHSVKICAWSSHYADSSLTTIV